MSKSRRMNVMFPLGGLDRSGSYRQTAPYTTTLCSNVRPEGLITGRYRGGSRPGLMESHRDSLGSEVRFLEPMILLPTDGFTSFSDTFSGTEMSAAWTLATWSSDLPNILSGSLASIDDSVADASATLETLPIVITEVYEVEIFIVPWNGEHHGKYRIYARMDDTTPDYRVEGIVVELTMTGADGTYSWSLVSYTGSALTAVASGSGTLASGVAEPGWLSVNISGDDVSIFWNGVTLTTSQTVDTHSATERGTGFAIECTEASGLCLVWVYRVQYHSASNTLRSKLIASAGGNIWQEELYGQMQVVASDLTVRDDVTICVAQLGQKLYVADYSGARVTGTDGDVTGTDLDDVGDDHDWTTFGIDIDDDVVVITNGTGTVVDGTYKIASIATTSITLASSAGTGNCTYRIERAPKIYDPEADTLAQWTATTGQVPSGCPLIERYLGRIFLGGQEIAPHAWFASRQSAPLDFDFSQEDSQRAVLGTSSAAGVPGDPLTALVAHNDDYLIMACRNNMWRLKGDPAYGGSLGNVSQTIGIVGPKAWCRGPEGELIFLSLDGIYILAPGGTTDPAPLSRDRLPQEFKNLDPVSTIISMEYDIHSRGIHVYLVSTSANSRSHWWIDWVTKTFWLVTLQSAHEPTATCQLAGFAVEDDGVILGGRDGTLRRNSGLSEADCGTAFTSSVLIGPIGLSSDMLEGSIQIMNAILAVGSSDVTWSLQPGSTFESCLTATAQDTGTWSAGQNDAEYPACRGQAYAMLITGTSGRKWAMEQVTTVVKQAGRRRQL